MFERVLLAFDGSEAARRALADIVPIASLSHGLVKLLAVLPFPMDISEGWAHGEIAEIRTIETPLRDKRASMMLKLEIERLEAMNITVQGDVVFGDQRYNSWIERWWRGTTAEAVIERAHCNVFISIHD
ncbi:MAG: universal stress protein [Betaproteobacteria bacterium]|nr:universal stress protein [Betaproteobacteria bacterium]